MGTEQEAIRALADLIISYAGRTDIPQADRDAHLRCAEILRRARHKEITYLEAAEEMEASMVAK
jgi:hypothetical protein